MIKTLVLLIEGNFQLDHMFLSFLDSSFVFLYCLWIFGFYWYHFFSYSLCISGFSWYLLFYVLIVTLDFLGTSLFDILFVFLDFPDILLFYISYLIIWIFMVSAFLRVPTHIRIFPILCFLLWLFTYTLFCTVLWTLFRLFRHHISFNCLSFLLDHHDILSLEHLNFSAILLTIGPF